MAAIGIAIGVASLIALVGIINSGEADAQRDLLEQGIDVLELTPGTSFADDPELLPGAAAAIDTHMRDVVGRGGLHPPGAGHRPQDRLHP